MAVFLDDHHVEVEMPNGETQEVQVEGGTHVFSPAGEHVPTNIGQEAWEVLLVELK